MNAGDFKTLLKVVRDGLHSMDTDYKDLCLRIIQGHLSEALKQLEDQKRELAEMAAEDSDASEPEPAPVPQRQNPSGTIRKDSGGFKLFVEPYAEYPAGVMPLTPESLKTVKPGDYLVSKDDNTQYWGHGIAYDYWFCFREIKTISLGKTKDVVKDTDNTTWTNSSTSRSLKTVSFQNAQANRHIKGYSYYIRKADAEALLTA